MNKKRQRLLWMIVALGAAVVVPLGYFLSLDFFEPTYRGKKLSVWLEGLKPVLGSMAGASSPPSLPRAKVGGAPPAAGPPTPAGGGGLPAGSSSLPPSPAAMRPQVGPPGLRPSLAAGIDPNVEARVKAMTEAREAFREMGAPAVPYLLRRLGKPHSGWEQTWDLLDRKCPKPLRFLSGSRNRNMMQRVAAIQALGAVGAPAGVAVPALLQWYTATNYPAQFMVRSMVEIQLPGLLRPEDGPAIMALLEDPREQDAALRLLSHAPIEGWSAHPALVRLLRDPNERLRDKALQVVGRMGTNAALATPALIALAGSADFQARYQAVRTLGAIGPAAREALPTLRERAQDTNNLIRLAAAEALRHLESGGTASASGSVANVAQPGVPH